MITGKTKIIALLGQGTEYSLSPLIHNFAAQKLGLDYCYVNFPLLPEASMASVLASMWDMGIVGFNITTPYKSEVGSMLASGQSVNVVTRGSSSWVASTTDAEGLARSLLRMGYKLREFRKVVILGDGGASRSVIDYLRLPSQNKVDIHVLCRKPHQDIEGVQVHAFDPQVLKGLLTSESDRTLLLQATSAPTKGDLLGYLLPSLEDYSGVIVDMVYHRPSDLIRFAKERSLPHQDGLGMLIEQARLSQEIWWKVSVSYEDTKNYLCSMNILKSSEVL
jgi:shikimate dehydrogenase